MSASLNGQKILIANPDGSVKQVNTDASGNLNVAVAAGMTSVPTLIASTASPVASSSAYASLFGGPKAITIPGTKILVDLIEQNVNAVLYQIKAGPTATALHTLVTDVSLPKNGDDYQSINEPFMYVDVLVKDAVAGTHGSVMGYLKRG